ncbi:MAG: helicase, partial [bacterium]
GVYEEWLGKVAAHLASCPCELGCPMCVHSPKCGSRNAPLDKAGALVLARAVLETAGRPGADRRSAPATDAHRALGLAGELPLATRG